jgi:hypothetical protein
MVSTFIDAGVFAIVVMASLPSLMHRRLRHHRVIVVALIARCKAGVVALVVMASLPLMHRHSTIVAMVIDALDGIVAVDVQVSLPLLQWQLLPLSRWHLCRSQASVAIKLMLLPS